VVPPAGTETTILLVLQLVGVAVVPLNLTVLVPCVAPKLAPEIVTLAATAPEVGDKLLMLGPGVKLTPLLATPPTVTTIFPAVAPTGTANTMLVLLQLEAVSPTPFKVNVLVP
jgi:hypothetical protein